MLRKLMPWRDAVDWYNAGVGHQNSGGYKEAIRCYDRALEIDPEDAIAWSNKGNSLNKLGRYDEAIRCCDRALEIDPEDAIAWNNKGAALANLGRYDEAIRCCDHTLEIDPEYAIAWNNKGAALANLGRYDEAIQCYDHMLEIGPEYAGTWNNKGIALKGLGRYDEAIRCYDRALEIDPEHTLAKDNREKALREGGASAKDASKETLETTADTPDTSGSPHTGGARESQQSLTQSIESVTASSPVTVERTIYDPLTRDFIISSSRPLVNVRDWIDRHDPSSYWLIICVHNHGNHPIDEWGIELESSSTLQMLETTIEGSDEQVYLQNSNPKPWVVCSVLGIPHQRGIVIPRGGSRRVYFRMGSESCGVSHSVRGRFITNDIEADIREKQFRHSCDVATLGVAIQQSPEIAVQYTESALMQRYHRTTALGYLHTFRLIQEINACCCAKRFEEVHDKLYVLEDALDKVGASGRLVGLVKQLNTLDIDDGMGGGMLEIKARRAEKMCKNIIDLWASEVLQV
ncbi:MAG: tetratricopeptide repeat protein [Methanoculleus sp.]|jgi:Flp pilus assembly protein TadD